MAKEKYTRRVVTYISEATGVLLDNRIIDHGYKEAEYVRYIIQEYFGDTSKKEKQKSVEDNDLYMLARKLYPREIDAPIRAAFIAGGKLVRERLSNKAE